MADNTREQQCGESRTTLSLPSLQERGKHRLMRGELPKIATTCQELSGVVAAQAIASLAVRTSSCRNSDLFFMGTQSHGLSSLLS